VKVTSIEEQKIGQKMKKSELPRVLLRPYEINRKNAALSRTPKNELPG
jgi:hypothetical protein